MKITRKQLKKIINEEINEVTLYNQSTGEPFELGAKTSDYVKQQLGKPPALSLEARVSRIEEKLDRLIQSLGAGGTVEI